MAEEEGSKKPKKDMGKILTLAFMVVNLGVLGGGAFLVYSSTLGHKPAVSTEEELNKELVEFRKSLQQNPVMYTMETFNTNLDGVPRRLIRMELSLEMLDEEGFEEVISLGAEARDAIVRILNTTVYTEVETVQGKLHLKNRIISQLNGFLDKGVVRNVYFSDFVVQ
ncbi:MAG: flagellar basal body-associated FliL family protein [Bdellovibrionaceae bacterium]|nr:flagellar basal body-associated FliL family protein [Bdellovibrionales bacterium]MCB9085802.1 flagellar basal body-associated FliL family protein [Pseudobdellovibrionaceae bacterium]